MISYKQLQGLAKKSEKQFVKKASSMGLKKDFAKSLLDHPDEELAHQFYLMLAKLKGVKP